MGTNSIRHPAEKTAKETRQKWVFKNTAAAVFSILLHGLREDMMEFLWPGLNETILSCWPPVAMAGRAAMAAADCNVMHTPCNVIHGTHS